MTKKAKAAKLLMKLGGTLPDSFFASPKPKGYVLTEEDRREIASRVSVPLVERVIEKVEKTEVVRERPTVTEVTKIVKELDTDQMRKLLYEFLANNWNGGGNANRNIQLDGVNVLRPFTDINFIAGSGITFSYTPNQTTKYTDITITGTGSGASLTEETPTGTVDGSNTTFTVANEPVFVVVDTRHLVNVANVSDLGGNGYTYSAGTIEVSSDAPPLYFIRSYYNA